MPRAPIRPGAAPRAGPLAATPLSPAIDRERYRGSSPTATARLRAMEPLHVEVADHIATVTLTAVAMAPPFFTACERTFGELGGRDDVRAIVIRGGGKAFSYGLDLAAAFAA